LDFQLRLAAMRNLGCESANEKAGKGTVHPQRLFRVTSLGETNSTWSWGITLCIIIASADHLVVAFFAFCQIINDQPSDPERISIVRVSS